MAEIKINGEDLYRVAGGMGPLVCAENETCEQKGAQRVWIAHDLIRHFCAVLSFALSFILELP